MNCRVPGVRTRQGLAQQRAGRLRSDDLGRSSEYLAFGEVLKRIGQVGVCPGLAPTTRPTNASGGNALILVGDRPFPLVRVRRLGELRVGCVGGHATASWLNNSPASEIISVSGIPQPVMQTLEPNHRVRAARPHRILAPSAGSIRAAPWAVPGDPAFAPSSARTFETPLDAI